MNSLREYLENEMNKSTNRLVEEAEFVQKKITKDKSFTDYFNEANPQIWTARNIEDVKYLFYNKKILNISKLKEDINSYYEEKGYSNFGFSKLNESDLIRYKAVKNVLMPFFFDNLTEELDTKLISESLFNNDLKDFDWQPEVIEDE